MMYNNKGNIDTFRLIIEIAYKLIIMFGFITLCIPEKNAIYFISVIAFIWAMTQNVYSLLGRDE